MWETIIRKTDTRLSKGKDVVVCLLGARIEHVTERVEKITGRGNGGSILEDEESKGGTANLIRSFTSVW